MILSDAIRAAGWKPPQNIPTGKTTRFATGDKGNDRNGWVYPFSDGTGAVFGCWRTGEVHIWQLKRDKPLTKAELTELRRKAEQAKRLAEIEREQRHQQAAIEVAQIVKDAKPAPAKHGYLIRKQIQGHNLLIDSQNRLIVKIYDQNGQLVNIQRISPDGTKRFHAGARIKGCFSVVGNHAKDSSEPVIICEGVATGYSLHQHTGHFVVMALSASNLQPVAETWKQLRPMAQIILAGDNDLSGVGQQAAHLAALSVNGLLIVPSVEGDFNDWLNEGHVIDIPSTFASFATFAVANSKKLEVLADA
jgi:putative DNA primase/helicase